MFDHVITGGTVVDGTGAEPRTADVAITDGRIVEVGEITGEARNRIEADGALVTPGWVDVHTHYDGQVTWDDEIDPSFSNGVTTVVMGNCGVGFAPVRPGTETELIELPNDRLPKVGQATVHARVGRRVGPGRRLVVGQRQVAHAEPRIRA